MKKIACLRVSPNRSSGIFFKRDRDRLDPVGRRGTLTSGLDIYAQRARFFVAETEYKVPTPTDSASGNFCGNILELEWTNRCALKPREGDSYI